MFYQASPLIFERAKALRMNPTLAEKKLWEILRKKQILGLRFKQQHPISQFIADFYCHQLKLVIEVDGDIHDHNQNKEQDENRTAELEKYGIEVIRFTNDEIFHEIEQVKNKIEEKCSILIDGLPTPLHPWRGLPAGTCGLDTPLGGRGSAGQSQKRMKHK